MEDALSTRCRWHRSRMLNSVSVAASSPGSSSYHIHHRDLEPSKTQQRPHSSATTRATAEAESPRSSKQGRPQVELTQAETTAGAVRAAWSVEGRNNREREPRSRQPEVQEPGEGAERSVQTGRPAPALKRWQRRHRPATNGPREKSPSRWWHEALPDHVCVTP